MSNNPETPSQSILTTRQELLRDGLCGNAIQRQRRAGSLTVARRGDYTSTGAFNALGLEYRHAATARAVALSAPGVVISHISAAGLH